MNFEERESIDEQEYLLERLHESLTEAQIAGDADAEEDATRLIRATQQHSLSHGLVAADERRKCELDGETYPCSVLKLNARRWRERDDFPTRLI